MALFFTKIVATLLVTLPLFANIKVEATPTLCSASNKLELVMLTNETKYPGISTACADGSPAGFYYTDLEDDNAFVGSGSLKKWIIWLGDSSLCTPEGCKEKCDGAGRDGFSGVCEGVPDVPSDDEVDEEVARCLLSRVACTSEWWDTYTELTPATILCGKDPGINAFSEYKRVFVPSCTLDYFLGNGNDQEVNSTLYQGNFILETIIKELADGRSEKYSDFNLLEATKIVLGGVRGGGIGALNQIKHVEEMVENLKAAADTPFVQDTKYLTIVDSSWIINVEQFGLDDNAKKDPASIYALETSMEQNSSAWISSGQIDADCKAKWLSSGQLHRCLYPQELMDEHLSNYSVLTIQSQYDIVSLLDLDIVENKRNVFADDIEYAQAAVTYIENYGQDLRASLEATHRKIQPSTKHFYFAAPCALHGYILPTRRHDFSYTGNVEAGSIDFSRKEQNWATVKVGSLSVKQAVTNFITSDGEDMTGTPETKLTIDGCGNFLCSDTCPTILIPYKVIPLVSICVQQIVLVYAFFIIFAFVATFAMGYVRTLAWKKVKGKYWEMAKIVTEGAENVRRKKYKNYDDDDDDRRDISTKNEEFEAERKALLAQKDKNADEVQRQIIIETSFQTEYRKVHLMAENLNYWFPKKRGKPVAQGLRNISCSFESGKVHALMGPSGSGKSTLMDVMSLTRDSGRYSGTHYINGVASHLEEASFLREWIKHNMGYVPQQDVFFPTLTAREHLEHAAWLMLPEYMEDKLKLRRVWQFMRLLDLSDCADTQCGDGGIYFSGGLSGGQRRRLSIATQLLKNPCLLFLDEPTSGLDSVSALSLMRRLNLLAHKANVNVVLTIHQPRKEIFKEIDTLFILVRGVLVFSGTPDKCGEFFNVEKGGNIGDVVLDKFIGIKTHDHPTVQEYYQKFNASEEVGKLQEERDLEKTTLNDALASDVKKKLVFASIVEGRWSWNSPCSAPWLQFVLLSRTLKRGAFNLLSTSILSFLGGLVLGFLFFQAETYRLKTGGAYLCVACLTFFQGIFLARRYYDEKAMFDSEKKSGTFSSWGAFLLSQFSRDAVTTTVETLIFVLPFYILIGFSLEINRLVTFLVLSVLTAYACTSQNVFIQIDRSNIRTANVIQIGLLAIGSLFNGFIVPLDDLAGNPVYALLPYIMLSFYGFVGVLVNEFQDFTLPCDLSKLECSTRTGDQILRTLNYEQIDVFLCTSALVIMIVIFRAMSMVDFYLRYSKPRKMARYDESGKNRQKMSKKEKSERKLQRQISDKSLIADVDGTPGTPTNTMGTMMSSASLMYRQNSNGRIKQDKSDLQLSPAVSPIAKLGTSDNIEQGLDQFHLNSNSNMKVTVALDDDEESGSYYDDDEESYFSEESYDEEYNFEPPFYERFLKDRVTLLYFFVLDMFTILYYCRVNNESTIVVLGITVFFVLGYLFQFLYQVIHQIPYATNGGSDFVWAGEYDSASLLLLLVDVCVTFIIEGVGGDFEVTLLLILIVRLARLIRVWLYFAKVDKAHRVTAQVFSDELQQEIELYSKENKVDNIEDMPDVGRGSTDIIRQAQNNRLSGLFQPIRPPRPDQPSRPKRPGSTKFSLQPGAGNRLSLRVKRISNRLSNNNSGSGGRSKHNTLGRPARPARPARPNRSNAQERDLSTWRKVVNPTTKKMVYYNPFTGDVVDENEMPDFNDV